MNTAASEFILMEKNLKNAIKNDEFVLHYQPYWETHTQKMVGMEALIRWQSKDQGLVPPSKFIPVLEETGMIIEVGDWVLKTAMRQVKNGGIKAIRLFLYQSISHQFNSGRTILLRRSRN